MSRQKRYLRITVTTIALVAVVLTAPLQAALAAAPRCDCSAQAEAGPADVHCPGRAATAQTDDSRPVDDAVECRPCPWHSKRDALAMLWARWMNGKKKGKPKPLLLASDCPHGMPARFSQQGPTPDGMLAFLPAWERCPVLCRFLL